MALQGNSLELLASEIVLEVIFDFNSEKVLGRYEFMFLDAFFGVFLLGRDRS